MDLIPFYKKISDTLSADIIIYSGEINFNGAEKLIELSKQKANTNIMLILCTLGGQANAAFKIARTLQQSYTNFYLYVYGYCKSAGTLIAVGSDEIIMSDYAEFGPLDVQIREKDEIQKYSSGLNIEEAMQTLRANALSFFEQILFSLIDDFGISTKRGVDIAAKMAMEFITPIVSQIDPISVGETQRAVKIALAYGLRLIKERGNLKSVKELTRLVKHYPEHGFVIDYLEASQIFKKIRKNNEDEALICENLEDDIAKYPSSHMQPPVVMKLYPLSEEKQNGQHDQSRSNEISEGSGKRTRKVDA